MLLFGDRLQILCDACNELSRTQIFFSEIHNAMMDNLEVVGHLGEVLTNDTFLYILLCIFIFGH